MKLKVNKEARLKELLENDRGLLVDGLNHKLEEKHKISIQEFNPNQKTALPGYSLQANGKTIGFADVILGNRDEYIKVKVSTYRNGVFACETFGVPKDEQMTEIIRLRYVVFLLNHKDIYSWAYKGKRTKPLPTLFEDGEMYVAIKRQEFDLV